MGSIRGQVSRLGALTGLAAVGATAALSACTRGLGQANQPAATGSGPGGGGKVALEFMFWGEGDQNTKLLAAVDGFKAKNANVEVNAQYSGLQGYFDKLATRVAGGNPPDIFQIYTPFLTEYIKRGAVRQLDDRAKDLGLDQLPDYIAPTAKLDGHYYFAILGAATQPALIYNQTILDQMGLKPINPDQTMDDYATAMAGIWNASGKKLAGCSDSGGSAIVLESYMRGFGKSLFDGSKLGFTKDELAQWLTYWDEMRKSGACVPISVTAEATGFQNDPVTTKKAAYTTTATSRGIPSMKSLTQDTLGLAAWPKPKAGAPTGTNIIPAGWFAVSSKSKNPDAAIALLKHLVTDPEAAKAMGLARGVPVPKAMRDAIAPQLNPLEKTVMDNYALIEGLKPAPLQMYPSGAGQLLGTLGTVNQSVGFAKSTIAQGVDQFFTDAGKMLS